MADRGDDKKWAIDRPWGRSFLRVARERRQKVSLQRNTIIFLLGGSKNNFIEGRRENS